MEIRELSYFVAVAEEEHFTRGAARLNVAQSAVSSAIARLERRLGVQLFRRKGRGVELTDAGRLLLERARVVLGEVRRTEEELSLLRGPLRGHVDVGIVLSYGGLDLVGALKRFRASQPGVQVRLRQSVGLMEAHVEAVLRDEVELMLLPVTRLEPAEIRVETLSRMQLVLACRSDDSLVGRAEISLGEVADRPYVDFPTTWGNRRIVDRMFALRGVTREVAIEVADLRTALAMVEAGLGLGFVPADSLATRPALTRVELADRAPVIEVGLASRRDRRLAVAAQALRRVLLASR